jgi:hypothetical protein
MEKLLPGDIFTIDMGGAIRKLLGAVMTPHTDMYHFGMIAVAHDDDYIIYESILIDPVTGTVYWEHLKKDSIVPGFLSRYRGREIKILRPRANENMPGMGRAAVGEMYKLSSSGYDAVGIVQEIFQGLKLSLPPWNYDKIPYLKNDKYTCIEAVAVAWERAGFNIIPPNVYPSPQAMVDSIKAGLVRVIFDGILE